MGNRITLRLSLAGLILGFATMALATPVYFSGTGHCYERIDSTSINWSDADTAAQSRSYAGIAGYLATITSQDENAFITNNLLSTDLEGAYWLGGFQPPGSPEPDGNWQWVTGETWSYTNWNSSEPNNTNHGPQFPYEDRLEINAWPGIPVGSWNDEHQDHLKAGYIIEYPVPEPATLSLLGLGGLALIRRKQH